jgi:hypothetical protein
MDLKQSKSDMKKILFTLLFSLSILSSFAQEDGAAPAAASIDGKTPEEVILNTSWKSISILMNELYSMKAPVFNKTGLKKFVSTEITTPNTLHTATATALKTLPATLYKNGKQAEASSIILNISVTKDLNTVKKLLLQYENCINPSLLSKNWKETGRADWITQMQQ